jgi:hypothetical protein
MPAMGQNRPVRTPSTGAGVSNGHPRLTIQSNDDPRPREHDEERLADRGVDHATVEPVSPAECESEPVGATDHAH